MPEKKAKADAKNTRSEKATVPVTSTTTRSRSTMNNIVDDALAHGGYVESFRAGREDVTVAYDKEGKVIATPRLSDMYALYNGGKVKVRFEATELMTVSIDGKQEVLDPLQGDAFPETEHGR